MQGCLTVFNSYISFNVQFISTLHKRSTNVKGEPCNALSHRTALAASGSWKEELLQPPSALWVHKQVLSVKQMLVSLPCTQCFVLPSPWLLLSCFKAERFFTLDVTLMQAVPLPTQKSPATPLNLVTVSTYFFFSPTIIHSVLPLRKMYSYALNLSKHSLENISC